MLNSSIVLLFAALAGAAFADTDVDPVRPPHISLFTETDPKDCKFLTDACEQCPTDDRSLPLSCSHYNKWAYPTRQACIESSCYENAPGEFPGFCTRETTAFGCYQDCIASGITSESCGQQCCKAATTSG